MFETFLGKQSSSRKKMAIDVCSDFTPSLVVSPRISFSSHDAKQSDDFLLDPSIEFDFDICINPSSSSSAISSADELFSNGKILPGEIKKTPPIIPSNARTSRRSSTPPSCSLKTVPENTTEDTKKKMLKDFLSSNVDDEDEDEEEEKPPSKPFWQFRRSSSLNSVNCENGRKSNGLIKSLQFLTRSNSTGSAPNPKLVLQVQHKVTRKATIARSISQKEHSTIKRTTSQKEPKIVARSSSVSSSSTQFYAYSSSGQNACLRKSYSNVIRINPVLNITPTSFTKGTGNLFGFCSILFNSKSNKNKK